MVFLALLTISMAVILVVTTWSAVRDSAAGDRPGTAEQAESARPEPPESLEGALVRQLLADQISGRQYRRAMQRLAERDVDRHPLPMPPES
ncbi:hypothetical protein [Actinoplanes sp. NPDC049599]|uniref:hypothetical protein n=1 Tax=Actinoplanes sp. NPDC049599 TaxID=3363903 RepID=UPI00379B060A